MNALPNKLSDLLELAVRDAQACESDPRYVLDMSSWHAPDVGVCRVCMAGAVMAQTLRIQPEQRATLFAGASQLAEVNDARFPLQAINDMRTGDFDDARSRLDLHDPTEAQDDALDWCRHRIRTDLPEMDDDDPDEDAEHIRAPWSTYLECVEVLRGAGL